MASVNSDIRTKAFTYSQNADGNIIPGGTTWTGVTLKSGEAALDCRYVVQSPLVESAPGTTLLVRAISLGAPFISFMIFEETVANINASGGALTLGNPLGGATFSNQQSGRFPFNANLDLHLVFRTVGGNITGGKIGFVMTYIYSKF